MPKRIPEEQIFEAALSVMAERGYAGATTREIAAAAGINEVTLFRRFESKARLLRAAVEGEVSRLEAEHVTEPTGDVAADLERVCRFYAGLLQRRGQLLGMLMTEARHQPELGDVLRTAQTIVLRVGALFEHHQRTGALVREPPLTAVASLLGPLLLGALVAASGSALRPPAPELAEHVRRFLGGRLAGEPRTASRRR